MTDTFEHNSGDHEDPVAGPTWTVSIVGAVLFVASVLGVAALYYDVLAEEEVVKVYEPAEAEIAELQKQQLARLEGPIRNEIRLGAEGGALVIPIEQAMELIVEEAGQD